MYRTEKGEALADLIHQAQATLGEMESRRQELLRLCVVTPSPGHRPLARRAQLLYEEGLELRQTLRRCCAAKRAGGFGGKYRRRRWKGVKP